MSIPLEDSYVDILSKAQRGLGINIDIPDASDEPALRASASALNLDPDRLVAIAKGLYKPAPELHIKGLARFNSLFDDMTVNSYLTWSNGEAVAFDTGTDCDEMLEFVWSSNLTLKLILLTHSHGDHIYDLDRLKEKTKAPAFIGDKEPVEGATSFAVGKSFTVGNLIIDSRSTWGHSPGGITYVVNGLSNLVAIVGDAIFAGSMGGGNTSYQDALRTNRENILSLPEETIICPGHGPMTTVGEQKSVNPFFPNT